ncbi:hypothetical protein HRR80_002780 [Exophiala dermatitidis]|uniref:Uncharacterized protein n=2 Tax=Exophiala dermatitidis TaxID=5970 RepID=H6BZN8_EXODN|nr:uncharacterized protein HMPREF1120_05141 [Exophiala dermatitidis NIH/UT8656]KAJ4519910.1 hypothetical protein HRR75_001771 [Exophiala dermatitidis]EHY57091.1 hypothetical protein HMPREF1120_05141 [Exophiala dermatitidis NIH/UT8656]KAJ4537334.1 hypothetical protein HRR76_005345 [Exophiala dermatitidis]KAJ4555068.1 hypothetical protein HRR77_001012 [Exophiala dermatitidis]KAJ4566244.1 hypothetical protein HRR79_005259 [Exophiala dermatitidis]
MAFQQNTQNATGGMSCEDALQLLFYKQPITNGYVQDTTNYLPQQSSSAFQFRQDNTSICPHMCADTTFTQSAPEPDVSSLKMPAEFAATLEEIKQGVTSLHTRSDQIESLQTQCNQLEIHFSEFQDWVKASMDTMKKYIEHHRQWSLIFKRTVESQIRDRNSNHEGQARSEGSAVESQDT